MNILEIVKYICFFFIAAGGIVAGIFGIVRFFKIGTAIYVGLHGTKYERNYSNFVQTLVGESIYVIPKNFIVGKIIIDEGGRLNTKIRKLFYTKLKHQELETIMVSQFPTETEKITYLLKQAVREVLFTCLLPDNFMETLIVYVAYKFARKEASIGRSIKQKLVREITGLKHSSCIMKLDSTSFEEYVVLNDIPYPKPLLEEDILPMLSILTHQFTEATFRSEGDRLDYQQQQCKFLMDWIGKLCDNKVRMVWIGSKNIRNYLQYLANDNTIDMFNFFIFGARSDFVDVLNYFVNNRLKETFPNYVFTTESIGGKWIRKSQLVDFKWIFCRKSSQDDRNNNQLGLFRSPKKSL